MKEELHAQWVVGSATVSVPSMQASYTHLLELLGQELQQEHWRHDAMQLKDIVLPSNSPAFAQIRF